MNSYIQLFLIIFSFIYGNVLYYLNDMNIKLFKKNNFIIKIIGLLLYVVVIVMFYIFVLYRLCYGELHIYFILLIVLGYVNQCVKKCK